MAPPKSPQAYNPNQNDDYYTVTSQPSPLNAPGPYSECLIPNFLPIALCRHPWAAWACSRREKIIQGELILSERALVVVPLCMPPMVHPEDFELVKDLSPEDQLFLYFQSAEMQLQTLLDRKTDEEREAYTSLHGCDVWKDGSGPLNDILRTNCFAIESLRKEGDNGAPGTFGTFTGVFLQLSRINHSCGPNASRRFHMPSFSMRLYAYRDIAQGEEITISYHERVWECAVSRQQDLDSYGFRCSCPSCANAAESDRRRARIEARYNRESVKKRAPP
ncbi:hypothetical protein BDZ89DRAFT_1129974 [Hymenopellis radicata]|nr:hypothetical protein BDZ89DRAFT_1129974 [Hymenopellis radicata]